MFAIDLWHKQISMFFQAASCCSATLGYGMASKDHKIVEFYDDYHGNLIGVPTQTLLQIFMMRLQETVQITT